MEDMQISMFDIKPDVFQDGRDELLEILKRGSGYEGGCLRIYAAEQTLDADRFISFLSDEFGIGGHSVSGGFVDYGGKGIVVRHWKQETDVKYSWKQVANAYHGMIAAGVFPDEKIVALYRSARKAGKGAPAPKMHYWSDKDD